MSKKNTSVFYLCYVVKTAEDHPHFAQVDQSYVGCWIQSESEEEAKKIAEELILEDQWEIERLESCDLVTPDDYTDDEDNLKFYEQALEYGQSIIVNECPRYPVYFVQFAVEPNEEATAEGVKSDTRINPVDGHEIKHADATVWVLNETVADEGADFFAEDFWEGEREQAALQIAEQIVTEEGWKITETIKHWPFSYRHCEQDESLWEFYEAAENDGLCLVIWDQTESV